MSSINIQDYVSIARPSHWTKHIFILPGIGFAIVIVGIPADGIVVPILLGLCSACLIASANYVINEFLDAEFDRHHPLKKSRPAAARNLVPGFVFIEYLLLLALGFCAAYFVNTTFLLTSIAFMVSGIFYNVRPFRTKDRVYLDVLTEAVNNPIRLIMGWAMISAITLPPMSLMLSYWFGGAFLMAVKRIAEYRFITACEGDGAKNVASVYRASFKHYSELSLLLSSLSYQIMAVFFGAIFLVKYRAEFILLFPIMAILITYYLWLGLKEESITQTPEKLYRDKGLLCILAAFVGMLVLSMTFDIQILRDIVHSDHSVIHFDK